MTVSFCVQNLHKQLEEAIQDGEIWVMQLKDTEYELESSRERVQQQATEILHKAGGSSQARQKPGSRDQLNLRSRFSAAAEHSLTFILKGFSAPVLVRSDRFPAGHTDGPRGHHPEPGPGPDPAEGEDQPAGGGAGGSAQPEPAPQRAAQTAGAEAGAGTFSPVGGREGAGPHRCHTLPLSAHQSLREDHQGYDKELSRLRAHYEEETLRFKEAQLRALEELEEKHRTIREEALQEKEEEKKLLITVSSSSLRSGMTEPSTIWI